MRPLGYALRKLLEFSKKRLVILSLYIIFFQNSCLFEHNARNQASSLFVYYQNYEYLSTVKLNDYLGYYGNVKLLRYSIPTDVLSAIWRLQLVATESCPATNVYFYLEYAAYPVISPHNRTFPRYFNLGRLTKTFIKKTIGGGFQTNPDDSTSNPFKQEVYLNISSPYAGYWFSAAFIDSNDQKVKPDLLRSNCSFYLTSSINLWQINDTTVLYPNQTQYSTEHAMFKTYKYISTSTVGPLIFDINFNNLQMRQCSLTGLLRQSAFPDMNQFTNNNDYIHCQNNVSTKCSLQIEYPLKDTWHYLAITSNCNYTINLKNLQDECSPNYNIKSNSNISNSYVNISLTKMIKRTLKSFCTLLTTTPPIETFRFIGPTYFSVKYYFNSNYNRSNALLIQNDRKPYFIEFLVDLANNGGTLNFVLVNNLALNPNYGSDTSIRATTTSTAPNLSKNESSNSTNERLSILSDYSAPNRMRDFNLADVKIFLHVCLLYNSMSTYKNCPEGYKLVTQSFTNIFTTIQLNVAYPMMGKWYMAVWKECVDSKTNESVPCPQAYVPYAVIQVASDQCSNDYCGDYGTCYIINSQLNLVSACKCSGGYEGYGCTDARNAIPSRIYLASVLFLTTSNLVFLLPICLALYRRWYIESLIYFYNMFFSTFYHACDQEFFSFCIFNYDGLQLADFISSYSSFVITVLSMSAFVRPWKVFTYFVGLLACLSINLYDRFNYTAFIIFLCIAISVTLFTWIKICISNRKLLINRKLLLMYYMPGFVLAVTGLLIYSFLQTKSNYWILHSVWHMCMAASIVFFLPKHEEKSNEFKSETIGENLKDVTTTTSSLSNSSGTNSANQSPQALLHSNPTEITLLGDN